MNYKELEIKRSYISYGENNIASSLVMPAMKMTKWYKRSVGYFSSSVFETILEGVISLSRNNGKIQLIVSPKLSKLDVEAISLGYKNKENIINDTMKEDFSREINDLCDENLSLLFELISDGILDIKIAVTKGLGDYHDKLGIMEDFDNNVIVFYGSANSSLNGYMNNYEKVRVVKSWESSDLESIKDEINEFDNLWNNTNPFVDTLSFVESARNNVLSIIEKRKKIKETYEINLKYYQIEAIEAWVANNYQGFFVMATGTGKTITAIYALKELLKKEKCMIVICAPYKHLINQWAEDIKKLFPNAKTILVSSENANWDDEISIANLSSKYSKKNQIIIISTIKSFNSARFDSSIDKNPAKKVLIVDEAHRFTCHPESLKNKYQYRLGLSATPFSGSNMEKGKALLSFFGGQVYNLPIELALEKKHLVSYNYYPIFVNTTHEEENDFKKTTQLMSACFKNKRLEKREEYFIYHSRRLRIISMASEKSKKIDKIIDNIKEKDHLVVYCGDGKLFDKDSDKEMRHIQFIKKVLNEHNYKPSQFTAKEKMTERMELVEMFEKNQINALVAIRCLDEGINIPSIKAALLLSSNDNYREFVQRRGRILRTFKGKKCASIYDVVVIPSTETPKLAKIELKRFYEYAKLASNKAELFITLNDLLNKYKLSLDEIKIDFEEIEDDENYE
ncbi:MAG: DEAD/DEAH box helicase family protein [Bacilli bacterium]